MKERTGRLNGIAAITMIIAFMIMLCSCGPDTEDSSRMSADDISEYDKSLVIEKYDGDLDSDLSIFPDEVMTDEAEYTARFSPNLFDTDGRMILECVYDDDVFDEEVIRLQGLSKTIEFKDEQYTNEVMYDEKSYPHPAYITIDGFGNTYEYALINKSENRIIYIYLAYPGAKTLKQYSDYVKKDLSLYEEENTWDAYSMYNHSFDGGRSWVEFDD